MSLSTMSGPESRPYRLSRDDDDDCTVACVGKEHITVALWPGAAESRMAADA